MNKIRNRGWQPLPLAVLLVTGCVALTLLLPMSAQAWSWGKSDSVTGSGVEASETRTLAAFDRLQVSGSIDVVVRQLANPSASPSVTLSADNNLLPLIETVVDGDTLKLRLRDGVSVSSRSPMRVTLDAVSLSSVALSGSGDLVVETFRSPRFELSLAGSSDAVLQSMSTESLSISIAGSGDVKASGQARTLSVSIAGSGDVALDGMAAQDVKVSIAGSGDASVQANGSLKVSIAGSGDVLYTGAARDISSRIVGSGTVRGR